MRMTVSPAFMTCVGARMWMQAIATAIADTGASSPKDMGRVMKAVMSALAGRTVDGKAVNELVKKKLSGG